MKIFDIEPMACRKAGRMGCMLASAGMSMIQKAGKICTADGGTDLLRVGSSWKAV